MADYTKTLARTVSDLLEPGERLLAAARGMAKGATKGIVGGVAGAAGLGAAGVAVGASVGARERAEGQEEQRNAGLTELPAQIALGLTDRRLLFFARSGLTGKAEDLVGGIPRERIRTIDARPSSSPFKPDLLTVILDDGEPLHLEVVRKDGAHTIAEAFGRLTEEGG